MDYVGAPAGKSNNFMGVLLWLGSPGDFNFHSCSHQTSSNSSITVQVFQPWHWFPWQFLYTHSWVSALVSSNCLYSSISPILGGSGLSYILFYFLVPRRVEFSIFSAFYLLGQADDFQVPYMWNRKLEVFPGDFLLCCQSLRTNAVEFCYSRYFASPDSLLKMQNPSSNSDLSETTF